jgi:hypothetical protein
LSKVLLNEFDSRKQLLASTRAQNEHLATHSSIISSSGHNASSSKHGPLLDNLSKRFTLLEHNLDKIHTRFCYLSNILKVSHKLHNLSDRIHRNTTTKPPEQEETSSNINKSEIMSSSSLMRMQCDSSNNNASSFKQLLESELEQLKLDSKQLSSSDMSQMPCVVYDQLTKVQEAYHHRYTKTTTTSTTTFPATTTTATANANQDGKTQLSSIEIKIVNNQTLAKMEIISHNIAQIEAILATKCSSASSTSDTTMTTWNKRLNLSSTTTTEDSLNTFDNGGGGKTSTLMKLAEYSKYIGKLSKCKELMEESKRRLGELKLNDVNYDVSGTEGRMRALEAEIDLQIDRFEQNLARQANIDKSFGLFFFFLIYAFKVPPSHKVPTIPCLLSILFDDMELRSYIVTKSLKKKKFKNKTILKIFVISLILSRLFVNFNII